MTEWPRSETARLHSLKSSGSRVRHLLLTRTIAKEVDDKEDPEEEYKEVVGHASLTREWNPFEKKCDEKEESVNIVIQSVVIHGNLRGRGLGRLLMQQIETFLEKEFKSSWLHSPSSVKLILYPKVDKDGNSVERFYSKLGFRTCHKDYDDQNDLRKETEAVTAAVESVMTSPAAGHSSTLSSLKVTEGNEVIATDQTTQSSTSLLIQRPPPPPSLPTTLTDNSLCNKQLGSSVIDRSRGNLMFKVIHCSHRPHP